MILIGAPCPKCKTHVDQCRDIDGTLMVSYFGIPANTCHGCEAYDIETLLLWSESTGTWVERDFR